MRGPYCRLGDNYLPIIRTFLEPLWAGIWLMWLHWALCCLGPCVGHWEGSTTTPSLTADQVMCKEKGHILESHWGCLHFSLSISLLMGRRRGTCWPRAPKHPFDLLQASANFKLLQSLHEESTVIEGAIAQLSRAKQCPCPGLGHSNVATGAESVMILPLV